MTGHGHVTPNADGSKARCGGPAICSQCAIEAQQQRRRPADPRPARDCPRCNGTGEKTISAEQAERMDLGERVRAERLRQYIHQAGLAAYLGIDRVDYSKAESLGIGDARTFDRMGAWLADQESA